MNYNELIASVIAYADRYDQEVANELPAMIVLVEARVSRIMKVREMSVRARIPTIAGKTYYPLPADYKGMRSIKTVFPQANNGEGAIQTLDMLNPEQMDGQWGRNPETNPTNVAGYSVESNQLRITPAISDGNFIEIGYYRRIPNLNSSNQTNWLLDDNPDVYLRGMLVEVCSFTKDFETADVWDKSFYTSIKEIEVDDSDDRWSGTPMRIKTELT